MAGDQGKVWWNVEMAQKNLSYNLNADVRARESDSSLALSLQAKEVVAKIDAYLAKISKAPDGQGDVVGVVFAINDKVVAADVYGSPELFRRVWPRLARATATEALEGMQKGKKFTPPTAEAFRAFMEAARNGKASEDTARGLRQTVNDKARVVNFETHVPGAAQKGVPLRRNYLKY